MVGVGVQTLETVLLLGHALPFPTGCLTMKTRSTTVVLHGGSTLS